MGMHVMKVEYESKRLEGVASLLTGHGEKSSVVLSE